MFFNEIDEGLWFYATGFRLEPVPDSHPRYNTAFDLAQSYLTKRHHSETLHELEARRVAHDKQAARGLAGSARSGHALSRALRPPLRTVRRPARRRATRVLRETAMKRNELVLLEFSGKEPNGVTAVRNTSTYR